MECTLSALIACFSWSGFYVDTGLQFQDKQPTRYVTEINRYYAGQDYYVGNVNHYEIRRGSNPYGRFSLNYEIPFESVTWYVQALHVSSLDSSEDAGFNSISINVRWYPFRQ